jgi:hypothetical protein
MRTPKLLNRGVAVLGALACAAALAAADSGQRPPVGGVIVSASEAPVSGVAQDVELAAVGVRTATSTYSGYTYLQPSLIGQTPAGFRIYVDPAARHHWAMGSAASAAAYDLHALGDNVHYRGYGLPRSTEGVVRLREGSKGCGTDGRTIGVTWAYWKTLDSGKRYVYRSDVYLCPKLFSMATWATKVTVRHELGHAMGLGHTNYRYLGTYQVMNAVVRSSVIHYRAGDRHGIERLVANTRVIKTQIPPIGKLESSTWVAGRIQFTGWALLQFYRSTAVTITLTDNGTVIYRGGTPILRPDVNLAQDPGLRTHGYLFSVPWPGGSHTYCVRAASATYAVASAQLGCVTWHG